MKFRRALLISVALCLGAIFLTEAMLETIEHEQIPFHNVIYPYVEFRPPPNHEWRSGTPSPSARNGKPAVTYTNEDGLRVRHADYVLPRKKPPDEIRIAMLGGSTVHIGTTYDVSLPGALERILGQRFPGVRIEVINAGIISAVSRQELVFLVTTVLSYDVDIVITYDGINDSGQMLYYENRPNFPYNYRVVEAAWDQYVNDRRAGVWELILSRSSIASRLWPERFGPRAVLRTVHPTALIENAEVRTPYVKAHRGNWERIAKIARAYGITPVFVLQPTSLYPYFEQADFVGSADAVSLRANYLVYEDMRAEMTQFAADNPETIVRDLADLLPADAYYDGAHVFDEINDTIAAEIADAIVPVIEGELR